MTDTCFLKTCQEPRAHSSAWCEAHWSLVPNAIKSRFALYLSRMVSHAGTEKQDRTTQLFYQAREDASAAIQEALELHKELP